MLKKEEVVVFDFDGTLSNGDSNVGFVKYCFRHSIRPWFFLPLIGIAMIGRKVNLSGLWWRHASRRFLTPEMVRKFAPDFIKQHKRERFGWSKEQVAKEHSEGRKVILVSGSPDYLIHSLVKDMKFDAILSSRMNKQKPWKFDFMCWGKNKVVALDEWAKQNKIIPRVVRSYADDRKADVYLMGIAEEQVWIDPKTGLRKAA